ncbi:MAG: DUF2306 domain-containing protein [Bryobacterales bacterium]|jgi:uncharacterized membrane protein|nr:DUF2306 domain-containing protein [Bryobacterales bacterium]
MRAHCGGNARFAILRDVSWEPLLSASPIIVVHAFAAMACFVLGIIQFTLAKGTGLHRVLGWAWVALMITVALTSFFIHEIRMWGSFSWIHLLSIFVLVRLPVIVRAARAGNIAKHRKGMVAMFVGALLVAGAFTLFPGRIMYRVLFGD